MYIIGAGLSGCIAGVVNKNAHVLESGSGTAEHQAVLRFRERKIGDALDIPFKEVRVFKSAYLNRRHFTTPDPRLMNFYAQKVTGRVAARSITDLSPVSRWVAPPNLHSLLVERLGNRVQFNTEVCHVDRWKLTMIDQSGTKIITNRGELPVISTAPLYELARTCGIDDLRDTSFEFQPITVTRWILPGADAHQTIYFCDPDTSLYRATLTGGNLIAESMSGTEQPNEIWARISDAFGLLGSPPEGVVQKTQRHGKIVPIDNDLRRRVLYQLTTRHGIYSLGRFALWKNILLDDVFDDLKKIRGMIDLHPYETLRSHA